ncbi:Classical arabinogalactan protein 1 [Cardamine amara subsp. amara]|uniref:Classical arabinogalactan protein 1 n=1 Tax=Cardamine amara subsp. amara TaxID=228776 RepID=A0ABD0ZY13_CARAN
MAISKILGFLVLSVLLISSVVAQSPAPAPFSGGGRRSISHSPKTPTPEFSVMPQAGSPSIYTPAVNPSSISSPAEAPGPAKSNAVSNRYTVFGGSVAVMLCAAVLAM